MSQFYKIELPFLFSYQISFFPLYLTRNEKEIFPWRQLKFYRMRRGEVTLKEISVEGLLEHATPQSFTLPEPMIPNILNMTPTQLSACSSLFDKDSLCEDILYARGKLSEASGNFTEALEFFTRGASEHNQLCLLHLSRIFIESELNSKYNVEFSPIKAFSCLTESFIHNGLLYSEIGDCALITLHLFLIYCDTIPGFLEFKEPRIQKLLDYLISPNDEMIISVSELREELETTIPKSFNLILGDIFHPEIIGISIDVDFNARQSFYSYYVKENTREGWLKVYSLNKRLLDHFITEKANSLSNEPIAKIRKNIYFAIEKIKDIGKFWFREEVLMHLAVKADVIYPLEIDSEIPNSFTFLSKLSTLGVTSSLKHLFLVFRTVYKAVEERPNHLLAIAQSLILNSSDIIYWRSEPLAFCYERGIGIEGNPKIAATLRNVSMLSSKRFLCVQSYKYSKWLDKEEGVKEYSKIFHEFCVWGISCSLETEDELFIATYTLAKLYKKGIVVDEDYEKFISLLNYIAKTLENDHPESFSHKCFLYKAKSKLKKAGIPTLKPIVIPFKVFIESELAILRNLMKDFLIFESISRGNIDFFLTECLHNTIKLSEKKEILKSIHASCLLEATARKREMPKSLEYVAFNELSSTLKSKLTSCHIFEEHEFEIINGDSSLFGDAVILKNSQKCKVFEKVLNKVSASLFFEVLQTRSTYSSPFILNIIGVSCRPHPDDPSSILFFILFEDFIEFLVDMVDRNSKMEKRYEVALKTLHTMKSAYNSHLYSAGFDIHCLVITFKGLIKILDSNLILFSNKLSRFISKTEFAEISSILDSSAMAPELGSYQEGEINMQATFLYSLGNLLMKIVPETELNLQDFISRLMRADIPSRLQVRLHDLQSVMEKYLLSIGIKPALPTPSPSFFVVPLFGMNALEEMIYLPSKMLYRGVISTEKGLPTGAGRLERNEEILFEGEFLQGFPSGNGKLKHDGFNSMFFEGSFLEGWPLHGVFVKNSHTYIEFSRGFPKREFLQKLLWTGKQLKDLDSSFSLLDEDKDLENKLERFKFYLESSKPKMLGIISCDLENRHLRAKDKQLSEFIITKIWPPNEQFIAVHVSDISLHEIFIVSPFYICLLTIEKRHSKISLLQNMSSFLSQIFSGKLYFYNTERVEGQFSMLSPMKGLILKPDDSYSSFHNSEDYHFGVKLRSDRQVYRGSMRDGKAEGYGEEKSADSEFIYKGFFKEDRRCGEGILRSRSGDLTFRGYFFDGKPKYGTMLLPDKELEGTFKYDERLNLDVWVDGKVLGWLHLRGERGFSCKGEFEITINERKLTGEYKVIDRYTNNEYSGFLENGVRKGRGFYNLGNIFIHGIWNDRDIEGIVFWGEETSLKSSLGLFKINEKGELLMEGFGALVFKKGNRYEGELIKNKLHGVGENKFLDGRYYIGEFDNGIRDGFGSLFDSKSAMTYTGFFTNGSLSGFGRIFKSDKLVAEGLFKNDTLLIGSIFYDHELITHIEAADFHWDEVEKGYIPRGHGKIVMRNENVIECSMDNISDIVSGKEENIINCTLVNSKEKSFFEGNLLNFKANGLGRLWIEGNIIYEGEFKNGLIFGFGSVFKKDGRVVTGTIEHKNIASFGEEENQWGEITIWGKWVKGILQGFALERMITEQGRKFMLSKYVNHVAKAIMVLPEDEDLAAL